MMKISRCFGAILVLFLYSISNAQAAPKEITWEDLIPPQANAQAVEFVGNTPLKGMPTLDEFKGSQATMDVYLASVGMIRSLQPNDGNDVAAGLDGQEIKIAGYVTPLSFDQGEVVEFLLVPYHGACIHVPPPPANQIVYVRHAAGLNVEYLNDPIWLTGTLNVSAVSTILANTGYSIDTAVVSPYRD